MVTNDEQLTERLPYTMNFQTPLATGTAIIIEGEIPENASVFSVNFRAPVMCCCFTFSGKDIAFSLSPHFDQRYVVRNSTRKKKWRAEQISSSERFPFSRGGELCIEIFVAENELLVAVDSVHYCNFRPDVAIGSINALEIDGDIRVIKVSVRNSETLYPDPSVCRKENVSGCISLVECSTSTEHNVLKSPVMCRLPRTLENGDVIKIEGRIKLLPYRFLMNLRGGEMHWPEPNILLHINGRYSYSQKNNVKDVFVFNSWSNGQWGSEKKSTNVSLPMPGNAFKIFIECRDDRFEISSDQTLKMSFPYRMPLQEAKIVHVQGDVNIYSITVTDAATA